MRAKDNSYRSTKILTSIERLRRYNKIYWDRASRTMTIGARLLTPIYRHVRIKIYISIFFFSFVIIGAYFHFYSNFES